jgi:hypothetical protein
VIALAADENFNGRILRGLLRRIPEVDVVRVQDTTLYTADDPRILEWAAEEGRVLLTHDRATLVGYAYGRLVAGKRVAGVIAVPTDAPIGRVVEDLQLLVLASEPGEIEGQIIYLPL